MSGLVLIILRTLLARALDQLELNSTEEDHLSNIKNMLRAYLEVCTMIFRDLWKLKIDVH